MKSRSFDLLPAKTRLWGAVTQKKITRLCLIYGGFFAFACLMLAFCNTSQWRAFAMGIIVPGGGFLAHANFLDWHGLMHIALALFVFSIFIGALVIWFATGNVLAPLIIWVISALVAASMPHNALLNPVICSRFNFNANWVLPSTVFLTFLCIPLLVLLKQRRGVKERLAANLYLSTIGTSMYEKLSLQHNTRTNNEFTLDDLKKMRFLLDRALQPLEKFDGFEWIDQFQTAAVRYQLNFMGYALSMAQSTHLSAFSGYLSTAQHNSISKQTDYRIWKYWQQENNWGNLQNNADPIQRDNIMFTGFCATQIAMFHAASGRQDYLTHNSFTLAHPSGQRYIYNQHLLVDKLHSELKKSDFHLMACEPNWVYPLCNTIGAAAMKHHNSHLWQQHQSAFTYHLEQEFTDFTGRFVPCRSSYTGFALPILGGALPQALPCFFLNAILPKIAWRQWLLLRPSLLKAHQLNLTAFWPIDTGNYGFSRAAAYAGTALSAKELGDDEIAHLCFKQLEKDYPIQEIDGVTHRAKASIWAHAVEFLARSCTKNSFQQLIENSQQAMQHPIVSQVPYPQVLVAHASYKQGKLNAVFYHGTCAGVYTISLANLTPHQRYQCAGFAKETFMADAHGNATIHLNINGRTKISVYASKNKE